MADVNVEFGAKDTGLEATLKTVQEQMTKLEAEVKSGTLSFDELSQKMRQLSQASKVSDQVQALGSAAQDSSPKIKKLGSDGEQMGKDVQKGGTIGEMSLKQLAGASAIAGAAFAAGMKIFDAALAGVRNSIQSFADALAMGGRLDDLSKRTGVAAGELMVLERAFTNAGVGGENLGPTINKLQNAIVTAGEGTGEAAKAFDRLGLSVDALLAMSPQQQFEAVSKAIAAIPDPAARSAAAIDIFGKSGGQLNQIFGNLNQELAKARGELGSLPGMMNTVAATFGDVDDNIKKISGKFMEFAAGVLKPMLPMIEAITTALTRLDVAKFGADLAQSFIGGTKAMDGFQSALNAIKVGDLGAAFNIIFESIKLQAMQTANEIYKNIIAAFQTAAEFVRTIFSSDGMLMTYITGAFEMLGLKAGGALAGAISSALPDDFIFGGLKQGMAEFAAKAKEDADLLFGAMYHDADFLKQQLASAGAAMPDTFAEKYKKIPPLFGDLEAQQIKVKQLQDKINNSTEVTAINIGDGRRNMEDLVDQQRKSTEEEVKKAEAQAQTSIKSQEAIQLEIDLNNAKAAGNEELVKELEHRKQAIADQERIKKLTDEYSKTIPVDKAKKMAEEMVRSERAAGNTKEDLKQVKTFVDLIAKTNPSKGVEKLSEKSAKARQEITAFGKYIGVDLSRMSLPDIAKKLGVNTMGMTGSQQIDAIMNHIKTQLPDAQINPVDEQGTQQSIGNVGQKLEDEFKQSVDLGFMASQGQAILSDIKTLVDTIKGYTETIRDRLPLQALA